MTVTRNSTEETTTGVTPALSALAVAAPLGVKV